MTSDRTPDAGSRPDHHFEIRIYYEDTDAAGIVYYANYLKFTERARTEMMRERGASHEDLRRRDGLSFVVKSCAVDYHRPAKLDDILDIRTHIGKTGGASLNLLQQVFKGDRLLVSMDVRLALLTSSMKPARIPKALIAALQPQYGIGK
ncbi:MAG: tol-pal system-associated acyl-CoA thioesterase [Pseudomonadota bacterium]